MSTRVMRTLVAAAGALAAVVALSPGATATTSPDPSSPSTPTAQPTSPPEKACYRLSFKEATAPTNADRPRSCAKRHTSRTYHVGRLNTVVDGHLLAVDSRRAQAQISRTCPRKLDEFVGGDAGTRALSRLAPVWFSPTLEQSDRGASWFRCDAVALARASILAPLPRQLGGILDRDGALDEVGLCGTAAPGSDGFDRVICSRRHSWRAVRTIEIDGGRAFPGVSAVREAGEATCRDLVESLSGSPDRFSYGWEWPTRAQWRSGQRHGFCWAPD